MLASMLASIALRVACAFAPGYVHPDEWFQSNEVTASDVFGHSTRVPWEYASDIAPARSVVSAYLSSGVAYAACALVGIGSEKDEGRGVATELGEAEARRVGDLAEEFVGRLDEHARAVAGGFVRACRAATLACTMLSNRAPPRHRNRLCSRTNARSRSR